MGVDKANSRKKDWLQYALIGLVWGIVAIPVLVQSRFGGFSVFELHFNWYALGSASAFVTLLVLAGVIIRAGIASEEVLWFVVAVSFFSLSAATEALCRLSVTASAALFWIVIQGSASIFGIAAVVLFIVTYTRPGRRNAPFIASILTASVLMASFMISGGLFYSIDPSTATLFPWGYNTDIGPVFIAVVLWILGGMLLSVGLLIHFYRHTVNSRIRRQARFYIFAFMIPIFGAAITDYGLPAMHIYTLPPMGLTTLSLMTVVLLIGIIRFNAFRLSPSILAQNILDTMRESVVVTNSQLEIEFMNAEAEKLFNLELEKAGKSDFSRYLSGSDKHSLLNQLQHLENKPHSDAIEAIDNLTLANTGHAQVNLRILASGVLNRGKLEGYLFAISDVTELTQTNNALAQALAESKELESQVEREKASVERKVELRTIQLRDERARLEASIDSLDAGFLMTDDKNNIITINGAAQRIIFHPDTINSETPTALTWQGPATTLNKIAEAFASSFNLVHLIEKCLKDQQPSELKSIDYQDRILDIFIAPIMQIEEHEAALGAVVLIEDITEEKIQERSKEEFFTITSHELRTPLTAIRGSVSIIQQYYGKQFSDPEAMKMLDIIYNSSVRLISIVNDFLEVSQLEQGRIELGLTPFAIEPMVETAKIELSSLNSGKNLAINIDKSLAKAPEIYASSDHIKQVLSHLIGNAISYTDSGSVTVSAEVQSKFLKVFVADTGVGISRENQKLLFRKLQQAGDNLLTHGPTKGTGLGLYISKLLIERMGGTIALESSEPSKGTTFSFTIPLATKKQITDAAKAKPVEIADEELRLPR